jgi:hypothetical protein
MKVMKSKVTLLLIFLPLLAASGFSQEKTKKELKEEKKIEQQKQTEALVDSKEFVFVGKYAIPSGMKSVNLSSNPNFMKFQPEMIESEMPFFGQAHSSMGYGGDAGLKFKGKPEEFTVTKGKKNIEVKVVVKGESDRYQIYLSVSYSGSASLSVTSNNKSPISYNGDISAIEKQEERK